jgi:DnaK suppressor protein
MALDVEKYRSRLIEERDRLSRELADIEDGTVPNIDNRQITAANAHVIAEVVDVEAAVKDKKTHRRDQVEAALQAIDDGTYGTCVKCGKPIDPRRLDADPAALTCMDCLPAKEVGFTAPEM